MPDQDVQTFCELAARLRVENAPGCTRAQEGGAHRSKVGGQRRLPRGDVGSWIHRQASRVAEARGGDG